MGSAGSYRGGEQANADRPNDPKKNELRRRATSDPKSPPRKVKSSVENALDRAYEKKLMHMASVTQKDVDHMKARSVEAEAELRRRLDDLGQISTDITRRLDYTYYSLLERLGSLVSTIHSFQSLSKQSRSLVEGFEKEAGSLDADIKRRVGKFKDVFGERDLRVTDLERRGAKAMNKAEQLGNRLECARIAVEAWEKRESEAVRARARIWKGTWFTFIGVVGVIMMLVAWKGWCSGVDAVKAGFGTLERGNFNQSLVIDEELLHEKHIPEDIQSILHGIKTRRGTRGSTRTLSASIPVRTTQDDDQRLRALDEL